MDTNEAIKQIHAAIVKKAKESCKVDGNNKIALEISGQIGEYGALWATAFGNDGTLDETEEAAINAKFNYIVDKYLPKKDGIVVDKAWNGFSVLFVTVFKGIKNYLNDWFKLGLCAFAVCALSGCKAFYENAGSHTRVGSLTAPVEVSEPSSSMNVRALYSMDGADVYTAKDSLVKITYRNSYTNNYFAIVKTSGEQNLSVEIEPLEVGGCDTNSVPEI